MNLQISEDSIWFAAYCPLAIPGEAIPPRNPNGDEDEDNEEDNDQEEEKELPVIREPDEE
jgi:hypothetical protein